MRYFKFLIVPIAMAAIGTIGHAFAQKKVEKASPKQIILAKAVLKDKIKGGWGENRNRQSAS